MPLDQVMHLASAEAILEAENMEDIYPKLAQHYIKSFDDMSGRAPGGQTSHMIGLLETGTSWDKIPFAPVSLLC